jgi:hypothetical protein
MLPVGSGSSCPSRSRLARPEAASSLGILGISLQGLAQESGILLGQSRSTFLGSVVRTCSGIFCMRGARCEMAPCANELAQAGICTWKVARARGDAGRCGHWRDGSDGPRCCGALDGLRPLSPAPGHLSETTDNHYTRRGATSEGRIRRVNHPRPGRSGTAHRPRADQRVTSPVNRRNNRRNRARPRRPLNVPVHFRARTPGRDRLGKSLGNRTRIALRQARISEERRQPADPRSNGTSASARGTTKPRIYSRKLGNG